ncbi:MAG: FHA domain-containing protein [Chloroflexota bacterium]|nr:FHA domain-containing protein [Chloroflexota bacterium]
MNGEGKPLLIMLEGEAIGRRWVLAKDVLTIGRDEDCDIVLPGRQVSRRHAQIHYQGGRYALEDLGSKNGTFVNGREVRGTCVLQDGDEIQIALCAKLAFVGAEATAPLVFEEAKRAGLYLDEESRRVWVKGRELVPPLSLAQYRLLELLYRRPGQVCSRDEIAEAVWGEEAKEGVSDQAIDALVRRLRTRIAEADSHHQYVVTVRGHGFRLQNLT